MNSLGKDGIYRSVPPAENNATKNITLDEQNQIDRIASKVDRIISELLGKAIEKKDYQVFQWGAKGGFEPE